MSRALLAFIMTERLTDADISLGTQRLDKIAALATSIELLIYSLPIVQVKVLALF